tara:strand:- start:992 stop:1243 length:252 start_codon:yes stop_codon:yes gene_type:complete
MTGKAGQNMVKRQAANEFLIWRAGTSVNWDCNATEIADDLGLSPVTVANACLRRGWQLLDGRAGRAGKNHIKDVVAQIRGAST